MKRIILIGAALAALVVPASAGECDILRAAFDLASARHTQASQALLDTKPTTAPAAFDAIGARVEATMSESIAPSSRPIACRQQTRRRAAAPSPACGCSGLIEMTDHSKIGDQISRAR
jgi:hypothetical protein